MARNTSSAVMQQRHEPHDSLDDFPTPPWATRALIEHVLADYHLLSDMSAEDPCCNKGYMVRPMREYFDHVEASDIHDYGCGFSVNDFLFPGNKSRSDWFFLNPPFRLALEFIFEAQARANQGVAVFVRTSFVESIERYHALYSVNPPATIAHFSERVILYKGRIMDPGKKYWHKVKGKRVFKKPSSATSYSWMVWNSNRANRTDTIWIPPCRKELERFGDYDLPLVEVAA